MIENLVSLSKFIKHSATEDVCQYLIKDWGISIQELLVVAFLKSFNLDLEISIMSEYKFERFPNIKKITNVYDSDFIIIDKIYKLCKIPQICFSNSISEDSNIQTFYTCCPDLYILYYDTYEINEFKKSDKTEQADIMDIINTWDPESKDDNDYGDFSPMIELISD